MYRCRQAAEYRSFMYRCRQGAEYRSSMYRCRQGAEYRSSMYRCRQGVEYRSVMYRCRQGAEYLKTAIQRLRQRYLYQTPNNILFIHFISSLQRIYCMWYCGSLQTADDSLIYVNLFIQKNLDV